jgi:two-component system, OmpR family, sensor histidine kinase VicK
LTKPVRKSSSRSKYANRDNNKERTEIFYGREIVLNAELQFFLKSNEKIDSCMNYTRPQLAIEIESIKNSIIAAKARGVHIRYLTDITEENIPYCNELMSIVAELRHLDGIKGSFMVSEIESLAPIVLFEKRKVAWQIIYSNVKEIIEHQQYIFDTLWTKGIPANQRIRELEQGIVHYNTRIIEDENKVLKEIGRLTAESNELSTCISPGGLRYSYDHFFHIKQKLLDKQKKHRGIRYVTNININNIKLVKKFLDAGVQVRHVKNLSPMSFGVSDKEIAATIEKMEGGKKIQSLLLSNEPAYVSHYSFLFQELWRSGIDATDRIMDIESGVDLADIEVIPSSDEAQKIYLNIVTAAKEEVLWIFPTVNAFIRQHKMGAIPLAKLAARERNVRVRILVPANSLIEQKVQQLKEGCPDNLMDVRYIVQMSETKATILVIDRKASLVMELRDDTKTTFIEAVGFTTYSTSKAGVLSYVAIFENLWIQLDLFEQLKRHDKMQRDFINIAAHELRTPMQPILGLTDIVRSHIQDPEQAKLLDVVSRNAKRLRRLTEDILDVTRIESQSLGLKKEYFNLNSIITNAISDVKTNKGFFKIENNLIKLQYIPRQDIFVNADKERINQVIYNLLDNAIKFTENGNITITITQIKKEKDKKNKNNHDAGEITVSVKDTGNGIDSQIFPRLFEKFATKSEAGGTGLGLFISKSIIEAHNGRIWAQNNTGSKGATFSFSLPENSCIINGNLDITSANSFPSFEASSGNYSKNKNNIDNKDNKDKGHDN